MCLSKTKKQKHFNDKEVFDKTLHQFSQYNKRQILGSYEKLEDYKAGRGVESIFNAIRPKYPVEKYSEVFGYNSGMKQLTKETITSEERDIINDWLDYYGCKKIRDVYYDVFTDKDYINKAKTLDNMFEKYDSFLNKNETIYRGIRFEQKDERFNILINTYKKAYNNNGLVVIDKAPSSFSRNKNVAYNEFAMVNNNRYNSIVFELVKRNDNELYIKKFAGKFAYQDEIVVKSHKCLYEITDIVESDNSVIVKIKEV